MVFLYDLGWDFICLLDQHLTQWKNNGRIGDFLHFSALTLETAEGKNGF